MTYVHYVVQCLYMSNFISISDARATLPELVSSVSDNLNRTVITVNGQPKVALISFDELESLEETAEILSIPGASDSIKKSRKQSKEHKLIDLTDISL